MIRFGMLVGVSTDMQARDDKDSIPDQIATCRKVIEDLRGVEAGVYVMDGYSRTGYDGLAEAMENIPPLKDAVDAAAKNEYDVLILDHFDRLGDLGKMLHSRFKKLRKQLYSARESARLQDPAAYDPYNDEYTDMLISMQGVKQNYRINKIRRGWNIGIPARVEKGLHPLSLVYGYKLTEKNKPAALVPEEARLIVQMKNMFLSGMTYTEIARRADASGIAPPRGEEWKRQTIKRILVNPFYAGTVRFRPREDAPRSEWKISEGKHTALWDESTHHAIVAEAKRRMDGKRNYDARYPFTGLTVCGICGKKISKHGRVPYEYMACFTHRHWAQRYEDAVEFLTNAVIDQFQEYQSAPHKPVDLAPLRERLNGIEEDRELVQEGFRARVYNAQEAASQIARLESEAEDIQRKIAIAEENERNWQERQEHRRSIAPEVLGYAIRHGNPIEANHMLTVLIEKIIITGNRAEVIWRD